MSVPTTSLTKINLYRSHVCVYLSCCNLFCLMFVAVVVCQRIIFTQKAISNRKNRTRTIVAYIHTYTDKRRLQNSLSRLFKLSSASRP